MTKPIVYEQPLHLWLEYCDARLVAWQATCCPLSLSLSLSSGCGLWRRWEDTYFVQGESLYFHCWEMLSWSIPYYLHFLMRPIVITDDGRWHNTVQRMVILFVLLFSVQFQGCECMCECISVCMKQFFIFFCVKWHWTFCARQRSPLGITAIFFFILAG